MKRFLPLVMLLMTASAANAGGLVTRHQSSLQHTVDPTRTITSRTANSFAVSGSGVTMDGDGGSLSAADLVVGGFGTLTNGAAACLLYTSPSPRDLSTSRMPSSA